MTRSFELKGVKFGKDGEAAWDMLLFGPKGEMSAWPGSCLIMLPSALELTKIVRSMMLPVSVMMLE